MYVCLFSIVGGVKCCGLVDNSFGEVLSIEGACLLCIFEKTMFNKLNLLETHSRRAWICCTFILLSHCIWNLHERSIVL